MTVGKEECILLTLRHAVRMGGLRHNRGSGAGGVLPAKENAREAGLRLARGKVEGISFNRRYRLRDGTVVTNPPKDRPDILGPVDPSLTLLMVEAGGRALVLANFALHADTLGGAPLPPGCGRRHKPPGPRGQGRHLRARKPPEDREGHIGAPGRKARRPRARGGSGRGLHGDRVEGEGLLAPDTEGRVLRAVGKLTKELA